MDHTVDNDAKQQLISALRTGSVVLLAGAGCSISVGYPRWDELVMELSTKFAPELTRNGLSESQSDFAERIVNQIRNTGHVDAYYNYLEKRFEPPNARDPYDDFHLALVQLGFAGFVTTNYDDVLESATTTANNRGTGFYRYDMVDLCAPRPHRVFEFLRSLPSNSAPKMVLHLHGYHRAPEHLILTSEDYRNKYGERSSSSNDLKTTNIILDSLHRRVLWTLLTMHPVLFIGFSFEDPFFTHVLEMVRQDFRLGSDHVHYALMAYSAPDERERVTSFLEDYNIKPVFFSVSNDQFGNPDYSNFRLTILELASSIGVSIVESGISEINRRMLEL